MIYFFQVKVVRFVWRYFLLNSLEIIGEFDVIQCLKIFDNLVKLCEIKGYRKKL